MANIENSILLSIYEKMTRIKMNDERFISEMNAGRITMPYYSARGQECIPASISALLNSDDYLVTIYRGIHDMLAKGVPAKLIWAELAGRETGACKGKGGPMHITHPDSGCMLTTGIVGAGLPVACGLALSSKLRGEQRVTVTNFGDGASNIGAFHESLNLASVWKLPVLFVCQNNGYAEHTSFAKGTACDSVANRASSYNMPGVRVDGNDPESVYLAAKTAIERARAGDGPTLIEAVTFRFNGHTMGDAGGYIPKEEYKIAKINDPYPKFRAYLEQENIATIKVLCEMDEAIALEVEEAVQFAYDSALVKASDVLKDVFA